MNESEWTRKICEQLRNCNALVFALVANVKQTLGVPDRYVSHAYWQGWLEFKGAHTRITALQLRNVRILNKNAIGSAFIIRYPKYILDGDGNALAEFDGSGLGMLRALKALRERLEQGGDCTLSES